MLKFDFLGPVEREASKASLPASFNNRHRFNEFQTGYSQTVHLIDTQLQWFSKKNYNYNSKAQLHFLKKHCNSRIEYPEMTILKTQST